ncbi:protein of unknown function UPF0153 [Pyrolobus fumarii 1A]|uniref:YkgJ family cysteine cluster protein n=1 Tax=Pyrolobus fumarii (strain DSM 11204 / 1A) TaxID=694429 RepID=G0EC63_PYRF1|nr:YkgJ family cysteine cluster protein [Pyrolobus fumarii]AEM39433.1 protein of unknown function UPF0153 [Pyrolobus fumarii 1A]
MTRYRVLRLDEAFRFKCVRCDFCCGTGPNVSLTAFDIVRIAKFLGIGWRDVLKSYVKVIIADIVPFFSLRDKGNGECVFMERKPSGETLCVIYPARPMRCRLYPVIIESLKPERFYLDLMCPGVDKGSETRVSMRLIEEYVRERREHYRRLFRLVYEEGLEPQDAVERLLEEVWKEAEGGAEWADLDKLEMLGSV